MNERKKDILWISVIFVLAFIVRLGYLLALRSSVLFDMMVVDSALYDEWGLRIANGDWLGGKKAFYDPPLYAYFLGVVYRVLGHDYFLVRLVQIIIGSLNCVIIYFLAREMLDRRAGVVAGILSASYKPLFFYDCAIMKAFLSSTLVDATLLVTLIALNRRKLWAWFAGGLFLGMLTALRVNMLIFAYIGVLLFISALLRNKQQWKRRLAECFLWLVGMAVVLTPIGLRNLKVSGQFILVSSYMGQNFYTGNNPYNTSGNYQRLPFVRANPKYEEEDFLREALKRTGKPHMSPKAVSNYWMAQAIAYIIQEPWAFVKRLAVRFRIFWNDYEMPDTYNMDFEAKYFTRYLRLPFPTFGFIAPLGLIGAILLWYKRRAIWHIYLFILVYMLSIISFFVFDRYRLAVVGPLIAFAGAGAVRVWELRPQMKRLLAVCGLFLLFVMLVNYPLPNKVPDSEGFLNLGTIWREKGDLNKAEEYYRKAVELNFASWEAHYFLATALRENGKCSEAIEHYAILVKAKPDFADALAGMGLCFEEMGEDERAITLYIEALKNKPTMHDIRLKLIKLFIKHGDLEPARRNIMSLRVLDPLNQEAYELFQKYGSSREQ